MRGLKPGFPVPPPPGRRSHLTRGAWIETRQVTSTCMDQMVAPHTRCVD
ncbi:hypothetical protein HMPREF3038_03196 [Akkermansia sp. KLE1797]|nr:hypothetical protein HMPREF3038_03196 [Akkermansia sp. KLE1797]